MKFVIDTSVATKLFVNEPDSKSAAACFECAQVIAAPAIFKTELACACIIQWRLRGMAQLDIASKIASIEAFCDPSNITLFANDDGFTDAFALAILYEHRQADCLFIALAKRLSLPLLSADTKQKKIVALEGITLVAFG